MFRTFVPTLTTEEEPFTLSSLDDRYGVSVLKHVANSVLDDGFSIHSAVIGSCLKGPLVPALRADEKVAVFVGVFGGALRTSGEPDHLTLLPDGYRRGIFSCRIAHKHSNNRLLCALGGARRLRQSQS